VYFEIIKNHEVIHRSDTIISLGNFNNELNYVPRLTLVTNFSYAFHGHEEVVVYMNDYVFHGIVWSYSHDFNTKTITLNLRHLLSEWSREQIATNVAFKDESFRAIYAPTGLGVSGWNLVFDESTGSFEPYHVYSRTDKLSGLETTLELTPASYYRTTFDKGRRLELGVFGEDSGYVISPHVGTDRNLELLSIRAVDVSLTDVVNLAVVYGDKSDTGMTNMNLRDALSYGRVDPEFPIVVLRTGDNGVNNERRYAYSQFPKLAPNNFLEFGVLDTVGIRQEQGTVIESSFSFNNLSAFSLNGDEITDEDRIKASQSVYERAKRELVRRRRNDLLRVEVAEIPHDLQVGTYVRLVVHLDAVERGLCDQQTYEMLSRKEKMYVTAINYELRNGIVGGTLILDNSIRVYREVNM